MLKKVLKLGNQAVIYEVRRSKRARRLRISVYADARVVVTRPRLIPQFLVDSFVRRKKNWIWQKVKQAFQRQIFARQAAGLKRKYPAYAQSKERAQTLIKERVEFFADKYGFDYGCVLVKNQRTRWGSCSKKGNLNFNFRLMFVEKEVLDYVVVHELCHLKQMNHSARFWNLVEQILPDYKLRRKKLKSYQDLLV